MTDRMEIVQYAIDSRLVKTCCECQCAKKKNYDDLDDIIQDTYEWLLTYDIEKLSNAYENKHLNALITGYLTRQLFSTSSAYFKNYVKLNNLSDEITQKMKDTFDNEDERHRLR